MYPFSSFLCFTACSLRKLVILLTSKVTNYCITRDHTHVFTYIFTFNRKIFYFILKSQKFLCIHKAGNLEILYKTEL